MRITKRGLAWAAGIFVILAIVVVVAAGMYISSLARSGSASNEAASQKVLWRVEVYMRKAKGNLPDLSWSELWQMTRRQGGFGLASIVRQELSVDGAVVNSYDSDEDHDAGGRIFRTRCAVCHGIDGGGWHGGPALNHSGLKHGDSDLAIYKILRTGVPATAMVPPSLSLSERWQVVGYIRQLQLHNIRRAADAAPLNINVTSQQILAAGSKTNEWLTYSGSIDGHRYSPLAEITPANVSRLRMLWTRQFDSTEPTIESTPIVVSGVMFFTVPPSNAYALDAKTGDLVWSYLRNISADVPTCCGRVNRGLAVVDNDVYLASLDGYLICINANTGRVVWQTQVVKMSEGYALTVSPLVVNRAIIVGVSGGEYGVRGFIAAYDPETGKQLWRFDTIPDPGVPGHETWKSDAWKTGGGSAWVTGTYDPTLDLIYWGVGNPSPDFSGDSRPGDNLYTNSVVALHASTGKLAWYFQFTPHDEHDWDSAQTPILADISIGGERRKVICWANRNGYYYVLDRATGKYLTGAPYVDLNWAKGLDPNGRPIPADSGAASSSGRVTRPGVGGGTNFQNPAYDQKKGLVFVPASEGASVFTKADHASRGDKGFFVASAGSFTEPPTPVVRALEVATGKKRWEHFSPPIKDGTFYFSGLLATGGGLVFGASGGTVFALDSSTGNQVWSVFLGADTRAAPISFTIDGHQVIAISSGKSIFVFGL